MTDETFKCPIAESGMGDLYAIRTFIDERIGQIEKNISIVESRLTSAEKQLGNHKRMLYYIFATTILTLLSIVGTLLAFGIQKWLQSV